MKHYIIFVYIFFSVGSHALEQNQSSDDVEVAKKIRDLGSMHLTQQDLQDGSDFLLTLSVICGNI